MKIVQRVGNLASDVVGLGVALGVALAVLVAAGFVGVVIYGKFAGWY